MPQLLKHIDRIAREKQRDVLYVQFHDPDWQWEEFSEFLSTFDYKESLPRKTVLEWLPANDIPFFPCGGIANERTMIAYMGQLYIDVPFDESNPIYRRLAEFLEYPEGGMKIPGVFFCAVSLNCAMQNAHHDEPGFWERWADGF